MVLCKLQRGSVLGYCYPCFRLSKTFSCLSLSFRILKFSLQLCSRLSGFERVVSISFYSNTMQ
uniref:Uncharacterized protein n=1 Tax=Arundo donax TaxID=35708 RepID=A0A0A9DE11_ARUDO